MVFLCNFHKRMPQSNRFEAKKLCNFYHMLINFLKFDLHLVPLESNFAL